MNTLKKYLIILITATVVALAPKALAGATLTVDDDFADCPNADFNSIQAAVLAAEPGSAILVCGGTYREQVTIPSAKSNLRLLATGAPGTVVLDGDDAFAIGFLLQDVTGVLIEGFTVREYPAADIQIRGGGQNKIRRNATTATLVGIMLVNSSANIIEHNTAFANPSGSSGVFVTQGSANNTVRHNETFENQFGILLGGAGAGNVVFHNDSHDNRLLGIFNLRSNGTVIADNRSIKNGFSGIGVRESTGVTVKNNRLERNAMHGIAVVIANDNLVEENQTRDNLLSGIALLNGDANTVRVNKSERNGQDGIRADSLSTGNHIVHNFMRENLEHDAHDDSVGPGTAGTANFWIKNNCETENRPGLCELPANHD